MNLMKDLEESGGCQSTDSNQSLGSITGSVVSGTSVTSGGHIEDNDDGECLTVFKCTLDSFSQFFFQAAIALTVFDSCTFPKLFYMCWF